MNRTLLAALLAACSTALLVESGAHADTSRANRYPYDPACAWGRVADGKGMIVRCMSKAEAAEVLEAARRARAAKLAKADAAKAGAERPAAKSDSDAGAPGKPGSPAEAPAPKRPVSVTFGELKVDDGSLPEAVKKLSTVSKRLAACVEEHGGLIREPGELRLRFLVRGRGRAEGVEVERRRGMSEKAGKCVADVVDRRLVGHPSVPITGVSLELKFEFGDAKGSARKPQ